MTAARSLELKRTAASFSISSLDNTLSYYNPETRKVNRKQKFCYKIVLRFFFFFLKI